MKRKILSDQAYTDFDRARPHIGEESFGRALGDVLCTVDELEEDRDVSVKGSSIIIAAAIHELSHMLNEHMSEFMLTLMETEE